LIFAAQSLWWAQGIHPVRDFQPDPSGRFTPVELQLFKALLVLDPVPDSPDDVAERDQAEQRQNAAWDAIKTGLLQGDLKAAQEHIWKTILEPTILGDGQGPTRDALRGWIISSLYDYRLAATAASDPLTDLIDQTTKLQGPVLEAVPSDSQKLIDTLRQAEQIRKARIAESNRIQSLVNKMVSEHQAKAPEAQPQFSRVCVGCDHQRFPPRISPDGIVISIPFTSSPACTIWGSNHERKQRAGCGAIRNSNRIYDYFFVACPR
jgi:hypothetical protein